MNTSKEITKSLSEIALIGMACMIFLILSENNSLLFHTVSELFTVMIAFLMLVISWYTYPFTKNSSLLFLGLGYFWVGILDFFHALSFKDMSLIVTGGPNMSTRFWITARLLEVLVLLLAYTQFHAAFRRNIVFFFLGTITIASCILIFNDSFPDMFIQGKGLTPLKIRLEFLNIIILGFTFMIVQKKLRSHVYKRVLISTGISLTIISEFIFTQYMEVTDDLVSVGHVVKVMSFWAIFEVIIRRTLTDPFTAMSPTLEAFDSLPDIVIAVDNRGIVYSANHKAIEFTMLHLNSIIGQHCHDLFHPLNFSRENCPVCAHRKKSSKPLEMYDSQKNIWLQFHFNPVLSNNHIKHGFVYVIRDITKQKLASIKEKSLLERLEHRNKEIRDFSYGLSHDLKSPLISIKWYIGKLKTFVNNSIQPDNSKISNELDKLDKAARHMQTTLEDISRFARTGQLSTSKTLVKPSEIARQAVQLLTGILKEKNITIKIDETMPELIFDPQRLHEIYQNLIENVAKHAGTDNILLEIGFEKGNPPVLFVKDNGRGIPEALHEKIFDLFERGDTEAEGSGMGLSIVRKIIELNGGGIWIDKNYTEGLKINFSL